jgi:hypothetical protein
MAAVLQRLPIVSRKRHQHAAVGRKSGHGDDRDGENTAQVARRTEHQKPRHAAARQHHAGAKQQAADDRAGQALRGGEEPGFGDIDQVGPKQGLHREDCGGKAGRPGGERLEIAFAHDGENRRAGAVAAALGEDAESQSKHEAADERGIRLADKVNQRDEVHCFNLHEMYLQNTIHRDR